MVSKKENFKSADLRIINRVSQNGFGLQSSSFFFFWGTFIQLGGLFGQGLGLRLGPGLDNLQGVRKRIWASIILFLHHKTLILSLKDIIKMEFMRI